MCAGQSSSLRAHNTEVLLPRFYWINVLDDEVRLDLLADSRAIRFYNRHDWLPSFIVYVL